MPKKLLFVLAALTFYAFSNTRLTAVEPPESPATTARTASLTGTAIESNELTRLNFEDSIRSLYNRIGLSVKHLPYKVFRLGMIGYYSLQREGALNDRHLLTIIDFSKPSTEKRFYTIDLRNLAVKYHTFVAHGRNTGQNIATSFSNVPHSNQSSLGFYVTGETYVGSKGYSLRLDGMEKKFNDKIRSRAVVIHGADYATESWIRRYGRLGRSQGCPALPPAISREVIDAIKGKTAIFTYYPDDSYLSASAYLRVDNLFEAATVEGVNAGA